MKKRAVSIFLCLLMVFQLFTVVMPLAAANDLRTLLQLENYGIGYSVADARLVDANNPDAELGTVGDFTFLDVVFSPRFDTLEDFLAQRFDSNHVFGPGGYYLGVKARFNGECTDCGEKQQQQDDGGQKKCSHLCHKSGFAGFIWKIARFFCKIFKINPVCSCGAKHY